MLRDYTTTAAALAAAREGIYDVSVSNMLKQAGLGRGAALRRVTLLGPVGDVEMLNVYAWGISVLATFTLTLARSLARSTTRNAAYPHNATATFTLTLAGGYTADSDPDAAAIGEGSSDLGGTLSMAFKGAETVPPRQNVNAAEMKRALEHLDLISAVTVTKNLAYHYGNACRGATFKTCGCTTAPTTRRPAC